MSNLTYQFQNIGTQMSSIGNTLDSYEARIVKLEEEIKSLHEFIDQLNIQKWGPNGPLKTGERLNIIKDQEITFEQV